LNQSLRIAVDITHPAHFHFFKYAIEQWRRRGHDVLILTRDKDLTLQLIAEAGWDAQCLSRVRPGAAGMALELIEHASGVYKAIGRHRSQVIAAIGGTLMVHAAKLRGIPALVFYDTEHAKLSNRITYPFATRIFTPRSYRDALGEKQERYNGFQELAYLHPAHFTPDPAKLAVEGLQPGEPFSFVRLVAWNSHHDVGDFGVQDIHAVVSGLAKYGRVVISSEAPLPDDLKVYERRGKVNDVHHVVAFARLLFGESATMASEAAQLGVPAIFLSTSSRGYTDELEKRYGMVFNFNGPRAIQKDAMAAAEKVLSDPAAPQHYHDLHAQLMSEQIDVATYITETVERYARS
jgi:uncharacterized protein